MEDLSFSDNCVDEIGVAVKLILDDIVEHFQKEKNQMVIGRIGKQEPGCAEGLQKVQKLASCHHRHGFDVRGDVAQNGEQAIKQWLQSLMASGDDLVKDHDQEVGMGACEDWYVNRHRGGVWLVETNAKVPFAT